MRLFRMLLAAGCAQGFACMAHAAAQVPPAGTYNALTYVLSAGVNGNGACNDAQNTYYTSTYYYPGAAKKGATDTRAINTASLFYVQETTLPKTPAAGVTHWTGTYSVLYQPGDLTGSGSFMSDTTYADNHTTTAVTTLTYTTAAGGTCTTTLQTNYILNAQ